MEVRLHRFKKCENGGRKTEKDGVVGKESDIAVGVTLEVKLHRFKKR